MVLKDEYEIEHELDNLDATSQDDFTQGWIAALSWVLGLLGGDDECEE